MHVQVTSYKSTNDCRMQQLCMSVNIPYIYSVIHNNMATTKGLKWAIDFTEGKK